MRGPVSDAARDGGEGLLADHVRAGLVGVWPIEREAAAAVDLSTSHGEDAVEHAGAEFEVGFVRSSSRVAAVAEARSARAAQVAGQKVQASSRDVGNLAEAVSHLVRSRVRS